MIKPPISRRQALKQTFLFSAAMVMGEGFTGAVEAIAAGNGACHYLMIGDWGWSGDLEPQKSVASAMAAYIDATKLRTDGLFLLGDNFYGPFKGGTACPRWKTQFEDMYPKDVFPGPCHALLGNHDYDDEVVDKLAAELAYSRDHPGTRWNMPSKWYRLDLAHAGSPVATVLAIDTNYRNQLVSLTKTERDQQLAWIKAELEKPRTAPWLVVMGHHPLYTNGVHGDDPALIKDLDALFKQHKVHFYFCGHDHDLQHMEFAGHPTSFVVSGGGGASIRLPGNVHGPFAKGVYGFTHLEIRPGKFITRHLDANGKLLHAFAKNPDGSWEALAS